MNLTYPMILDARAHRVGRCVNDLYCSLASSGQDQRVPVDAHFLCSQCGKTLVLPAEAAASNRRLWLAVAGLGVAAAVIGGAFALCAPAAPAPAFVQELKG